MYRFNVFDDKTNFLTAQKIVTGVRLTQPAHDKDLQKFELHGRMKTSITVSFIYRA
jgi:hypothetical protein